MDETVKENRVHRKVMNTRDEFIKSDDFDHDEALEAGKQLSIKESFY